MSPSIASHEQFSPEIFRYGKEHGAPSLSALAAASVHSGSPLTHLESIAHRTPPQSAPGRFIITLQALFDSHQGVSPSIIA